jgi:hypothetical protein
LLPRLVIHAPVPDLDVAGGKRVLGKTANFPCWSLLPLP